ncbi:MAG: hypothetical protein V1735_04450 [Nanoarchaeota archaeon]
MRNESDFTNDDDFWEDDNIYNEDVRDEMLENDELKAEEVAFLNGYDEVDAAEPSEL